MTTRALPVLLEFESGYPASEGTAVVVDRGVAARVTRALLSLAVCMGFAFLCVFVPIAHFVLVPSFLITGIVLCVIRLRETASLVEVRGTCPRCKEAKVFPAGGRFRNHRTLRCNQCAEQMSMTEHS